MSKESVLEAIQAKVGQEPVTGPWLTVDRAMIDMFTSLSHEDSFIHTDSERTRRETPYEDIIAQGNLALSLSNRLTHDARLLDGIAGEARLGLNYGWNKIRFPAPLPVDARVRGSIAIKAVHKVSGDGVEVVKEIVIGIEHQDKPCFVGESVSRFYF